MMLPTAMIAVAISTSALQDTLSTSARRAGPVLQTRTASWGGPSPLIVHGAGSRRIDVIRRDAGGTGAERPGAGSLERRPAAGVVCRGLQGGSYPEDRLLVEVPTDHLDADRQAVGRPSEWDRQSRRPCVVP